VRGWRHALHTGIPAEGKAKAFHGLFDRHILLARIHSSKGVSAHEEQMKAEEGKTEVVMVDGSACPIEGGESLQFRRGKMGHTYFAQVQLSAPSVSTELS
jgi:hypothetical protein